MEERKMYLWRVSHPVHGETEVVASERYSAVLAAAHEWGLRWSTIARDCRVEQLGEASPKDRGIAMSPSAPRNDKRKGGGRNGKAHKIQHRDH